MDMATLYLKNVVTDGHRAEMNDEVMESYFTMKIHSFDRDHVQGFGTVVHEAVVEHRGRIYKIIAHPDVINRFIEADRMNDPHARHRGVVVEKHEYVDR